METKNRADVVTELASKLEVTKKRGAEILEAFIDIVEESVANGDKIAISNFMTIECVERAARMGRNPKTQEKISIPAKTAPKAKFGKRIREIANDEISL